MGGCRDTLTKLWSFNGRVSLFWPKIGLERPHSPANNLKTTLATQIEPNGRLAGQIKGDSLPLLGQIP